jgi:hypothetical protein
LYQHGVAAEDGEYAPKHLEVVETAGVLGGIIWHKEPE